MKSIIIPMMIIDNNYDNKINNKNKDSNPF